MLLMCTEDWSDKASENSSTNDEAGSGMDADTDAAAPATSKPKKPSKAQHVSAIRKNHLNIVFIGHVGKCLYLSVYCHGLYGHCVLEATVL